MAGRWLPQLVKGRCGAAGAEVQMALRGGRSGGEEALRGDRSGGEEALWGGRSGGEEALQIRCSGGGSPRSSGGRIFSTAGRRNPRNSSPADQSGPTDKVASSIGAALLAGVEMWRSCGAAGAEVRRRCRSAAPVTAAIEAPVGRVDSWRFVAARERNGGAWRRG